MRFLILLLTHGEKAAEGAAGLLDYNEDLRRAGALLAHDRLRVLSGIDSSAGHLDGGRSRGPAGAIAAFWLIEVRSREEALEWSRRFLLPEGCTIEVHEAVD